ncbi:MAG: hypothetical protein IKZ82_04410 [Clostridia bacterium]|nr:hypothetical protein [Clostridia bacterium]
MSKLFSKMILVAFLLIGCSLIGCSNGQKETELEALNAFWDIKPEDVEITLDIDSNTDTAVFTWFKAESRNLTGHICETAGDPEELFKLAEKSGELTGYPLNGLKLNIHGELPISAAYSAYYMDQHGKVKYDSLSSGGSFELEGGSAASVFGFHSGNYVSSNSDDDIRRCFVIELKYEAKTVCYFISESSTTAE